MINFGNGRKNFFGGKLKSKVDSVEGWAKRHPVWFSIIAVVLGYVVFRPACIWLLGGSNEGIGKEISNSPTAFISLILAPYFWVLWIWRHSHKETEVRLAHENSERNKKLDKIRDRENITILSLK